MLYCMNKVLFVGGKVELPTWLQADSLNEDKQLLTQPYLVINYPSQYEV